MLSLYYVIEFVIKDSLLKFKNIKNKLEKIFKVYDSDKDI
jgi:hypothetical protein